MITDIQGADYCALSYARPNLTLPGDVAAYVERNGKRLVVAPRGTTKDPRDWLRDVFACPLWIELLGCYVHPGAYFAAAAIWHALRRSGAVPMPAALAELEVHLFGHSLGGMIAAPLAGLFIVHGLTPRQLVTYDPGHSGFAGLARLLEPIEDRRVYWTGNDRVPLVPFWLPWWPYRHYVRPTRIGAAQRPWWHCHELANIRAVLAGDQQQAKLLDPAAVAVDADQFAAAIGP